MKFARVFLAGLGLALLPGARASELTNADAVLQFVLRQSDSYESFTADFTQSLSMLGALTEMTGSIQFRKPAQTRMEMNLALTGPTQRVVAVLSDDQVLWQETSSGGPATVMRMDLKTIPSNHPAAAVLKNPFETVDPQRFIARVKTDYTETLVGTAELHGQPMYILEGTLRPDVKVPVALSATLRSWGKQRLHIGQRDGFVHKIEQFDLTDTNLVMILEFPTVRFNADLPEQFFHYQPPATATVIDMTQILLQMLRRR